MGREIVPKTHPHSTVLNLRELEGIQTELRKPDRGQKGPD